MARESSPRSPRETLPFLSADYWRRWGRWIGRGVPIVSGGLRIPTFLMMAVLCVRGALTLSWTMEACQRLRRIGGRITRILCDICGWAEFYLSPLPGNLALLKSLQILCMWVGEASWCRLAAQSRWILSLDRACRPTIRAKVALAPCFCFAMCIKCFGNW